MVTKALVGLLKNLPANLGITSMESGKVFLKKASTSLRSFNKSNEFSPHQGMNKVQVKLPSKLGRAINI
jgi:hypothetical protein